MKNVYRAATFSIHWYIEVVDNLKQALLHSSPPTVYAFIDLCNRFRNCGTACRGMLSFLKNFWIIMWKIFDNFIEFFWLIFETPLENFSKAILSTLIEIFSEKSKLGKLAIISWENIWKQTGKGQSFY